MLERLKKWPFPLPLSLPTSTQNETQTVTGQLALLLPELSLVSQLTASDENTRFLSSLIGVDFKYPYHTATEGTADRPLTHCLKNGREGKGEDSARGNGSSIDGCEMLDF